MAPDMSQPRVQRFHETRPDWNCMPDAQQSGFNRGGYPSMVGSNYQGRVVLLPRGQGAPWHSNTAEHIICQLEGTVIYEIGLGEDAKQYPVSKYDILFIPANAPYQYWNAGDCDAAWFTVLGSVGDWPPVGNYDY